MWVIRFSSLLLTPTCACTYTIYNILHTYVYILFLNVEFYVYYWFAYMFVYMYSTCTSKWGQKSVSFEVEGCRLLCGCGKINSGTLEEHTVLYSLKYSCNYPYTLIFCNKHTLAKWDSYRISGTIKHVIKYLLLTWHHNFLRTLVHFRKITWNAEIYGA